MSPTPGPDTSRSTAPRPEPFAVDHPLASAAAASSASAVPASYGYFIVHAHLAARDAGPVVEGLLEDLRTGTKRPFASSAELSRLVDDWGGITPFAPHAVDGQPSPARSLPSPRPEDR